LPALVAYSLLGKGSPLIGLPFSFFSEDTDFGTKFSLEYLEMPLFTVSGFPVDRWSRFGK